MKSFDEDIVIQPLLALEENWDSYGARKIQNPVIYELRNATMKVVPTTHGGVVIEYNFAGYHLEFELGPDGSLMVVMSEKET